MVLFKPKKFLCVNGSLIFFFEWQIYLEQFKLGKSTYPTVQCASINIYNWITDLFIFSIGCVGDYIRCLGASYFAF
jgi:hypothetical protein